MDAVAASNWVNIACAATAIGLLRGQRWGYRLAVVLLLVNLIGRVVNFGVGIEPRAVVDIPVVALILWYLRSPKVKTFFSAIR